MADVKIYENVFENFLSKQLDISQGNYLKYLILLEKLKNS
ncbi:MAG: hypothetical protein PWP54_816 [Thermosipho sp. (in: thermotogales)]|nr:hypothetical protein [Thermosipho sp. (in: thermotogales)]